MSYSKQTVVDGFRFCTDLHSYFNEKKKKKDSDDKIGGSDKNKIVEAEKHWLQKENVTAVECFINNENNLHESVNAAWVYALRSSNVIACSNSMHLLCIQCNPDIRETRI